MTQIAQKPIVKRNRKEGDMILINQIRNGSHQERQNAYKTLYSSYHSYLLNYYGVRVKYRSDAEDLALRALGKAFNNLEKFDDKYAFSTWLQTLATNLLIDFKRKGTLEVQSLEDLSHTNSEGDVQEFELEDQNRTPLENVERKDIHSNLKSVLEKLKPKFKTILKLRYFKELTYEEIAAELEIPMGTVKARLLRAKEKLGDVYSALPE